MPNKPEQFRWGCEKHNGLMLVSPIFNDYDACYEDYFKCMKKLRDTQGIDLSTMPWRGVYNLEQIALVVMNKSIYMNELEVKEFEW